MPSKPPTLVTFVLSMAAILAISFACGQHWQAEISPTTGWLTDAGLRRVKDMANDEHATIPNNLQAVMISLVDEVEICRVMVGYTGDEGLTIGDFERRGDPSNDAAADLHDE